MNLGCPPSCLDSAAVERLSRQLAASAPRRCSAPLSHGGGAGCDSGGAAGRCGDHPPLEPARWGLAAVCMLYRGVHPSPLAAAASGRPGMHCSTLGHLHGCPPCWCSNTFCLPASLRRCLQWSMVWAPCTAAHGTAQSRQWQQKGRLLCTKVGGRGAGRPEHWMLVVLRCHQAVTLQHDGSLTGVHLPRGCLQDAPPTSCAPGHTPCSPCCCWTACNSCWACSRQASSSTRRAPAGPRQGRPSPPLDASLDAWPILESAHYLI